MNNQITGDTVGSTCEPILIDLESYTEPLYADMLLDEDEFTFDERDPGREGMDSFEGKFDRLIACLIDRTRGGDFCWEIKPIRRDGIYFCTEFSVRFGNSLTISIEAEEWRRNESERMQDRGNIFKVLVSYEGERIFNFNAEENIIPDICYGLVDNIQQMAFQDLENQIILEDAMMENEIR